MSPKWNKHWFPQSCGANSTFKRLAVIATLFTACKPKVTSDRRQNRNKHWFPQSCACLSQFDWFANLWPPTNRLAQAAASAKSTGFRFRDRHSFYGL
jgi:hypothetical protein